MLSKSENTKFVYRLLDGYGAPRLRIFASPRPKKKIYPFSL